MGKDAWQLDRKMSKRQYEQIIDDLGMNQLEAARYLGFSGRSSRRMVSGHAKIPVSVALLLRSLVAHNEQPVVPDRKRGEN